MMKYRVSNLSSVLFLFLIVSYSIFLLLSELNKPTARIDSQTKECIKVLTQEGYGKCVDYYNSPYKYHVIYVQSYFN